MEDGATRSLLPREELVLSGGTLGTGMSEQVFTTAKLARSLQYLVHRATARTDKKSVGIGFISLLLVPCVLSLLHAILVISTAVKSQRKFMTQKSRKETLNENKGPPKGSFPGLCEIGP